MNTDTNQANSNWKSSGKKWLDRLIFITVFGLTGTSTAWIAALIRPWFGITADTSLAVKIIYFVFLTLPLYQMVLLIWGWIFGRFHYFVQYEKRFFSRIGHYFKKMRH